MRYPLFVDLTGRRVVVVGGGRVAARRVVDLTEAGAQVVVVAPAFGEDLERDGVELVERSYESGDLDGAWLALACTDDPVVNERVGADAEARGLWCIRADSSADSSAWRPATTSVDDVTVAVSAGGDPSRAVTVRDAIKARMLSAELVARRGRDRRDGSGMVTLVGGGPGDPDLVTIAGMRALLDADVIVTDRLGPTGLLDGLDTEIEIVDVGKTPRGHAAEQSDINALLIERAHAGQRVVRLKGGDSFVFGRGSEEVDACLANGVDVRVIPGVTSATAAAALAGIALTERGTTQQFVVASGHVPPGDTRSTVDWASLAGTDATLVLLMAVANLGPIAETLIVGGRDPQTGAAIVENASMPDQRVVRCRLSEVAAVAAREGVQPPAVVLVGDVVRVN